MMHYYIEEREAYRGVMRYHVCSIDLDVRPPVIHIHDICRTQEQADQQLKLVKQDKHPTQTHPAGSLWKR